MNNKVHVCLVTDKNYISRCQSCIYEILACKNKNTNYCFYVLLDNVEDTKTFDAFKSVTDISLIHMNSSSIYQAQNPYSKANNSYITKSALLKNLIPNIKELENINRVLYLDSDILVLKDLTDLYNTNLEGKALGICKNPVRVIQGLLVNMIFDYIDKCHMLNTGIMLMDLKKLRDLNFSEKCINRSLESGYGNEHVVTELFFNETTQLSPIFNIPYSMTAMNFPNMNNVFIWNLFYGTCYKTISELLNDACILHLVGDINLQKANPRLKKIYDLLNRRLDEFLILKKVIPLKENIFEI